MSNKYLGSTSKDTDPSVTITDKSLLVRRGINMEGVLAILNFGTWNFSVLKVVSHSGSELAYDTHVLNRDFYFE